jgi:glutamate racemase
MPAANGFAADMAATDSAARPDGPAPLRLGIFDSGAGGLSVASAVRALLPGHPIVYYADTAHAPYGERDDAHIRARTEACCHALLERGVGAIVVACNTATARAIEQVRRWAGVPVVGIEPGLKPAAAVTAVGRVGVLATPATLASRRFAELTHRVGQQFPHVSFHVQAGRGWVELVEAGELDTERARATVAADVQPLLHAGVDTLVLGCTHYPFLKHLIAQTAGPGVQLIETGPAVARELARRLDLATRDIGTRKPATHGLATHGFTTHRPATHDRAGASAGAEAGAEAGADFDAAFEIAASGDTAAFARLAARLLRDAPPTGSPDARPIFAGAQPCAS